MQSRLTFVKEMAKNAARTVKKTSAPAEVPDVAAAVECVFGCKWSIRILRLIRSGVLRPGAIERSLDGLTTKVQHHYFQRMVSLGILRRTVFPEVPPRVEYDLTPFGRRLVPLLESIDRLQAELGGGKMSPDTDDDNEASQR
jgi:DNA-binding HxlR family transcriptional regulator